MAKYRDKTKSRSQAKVVDYKDNEQWRDRHHRRFSTNQEYVAEFRRLCDESGYEFRVLNNGEHWQIKANGNCFDWWPRSAKLIINKQWKNGIHVHDITQLIQEIVNNS